MVERVTSYHAPDGNAAHCYCGAQEEEAAARLAEPFSSNLIPLGALKTHLL